MNAECSGPGVSILGRYLVALDDNDADGVSRLFAPECVYVPPVVTPGGFGSLELIRNRDGVRRYIEQRSAPPYRHRLLAAWRSNGQAFGLGVSTGSMTSAFLVTAVLDQQDLIVWYFGTATVAAPADLAAFERSHVSSPLDDDAASSMPRTISQYLAAIDADDFETASRCFSIDATYSAPANEDGAARVELTGREAIRQYFDVRRGPQLRSHVVHRFASTPGACFVEGAAFDRAGGPIGSFVASYELDEQGRITSSVVYSAGVTQQLGKRAPA